jgi:hypothetical protein
MKDSDKVAFKDLIEDLEMVVPPKEIMDVRGMRLYFNSLIDYTIEEVTEGVRAYIKKGKWFPKIAELVECIEAAKPTPKGMARLGPDEAFAVALRALDEEDTVVWSDEIEQAWHSAAPLARSGDMVGARMAFKQAYERITAGKTSPPRAAVSVGHSASLREDRIKSAVSMGLLTADHPEALRLPAPIDQTSPIAAVAGALTGKPMAQIAHFPSGVNREEGQSAEEYKAKRMRVFRDLKAAIAEGEQRQAADRAERADADRRRLEELRAAQVEAARAERRQKQKGGV